MKKNNIMIICAFACLAIGLAALLYQFYMPGSVLQDWGMDNGMNNNMGVSIPYTGPGPEIEPGMMMSGIDEMNNAFFNGTPPQDGEYPGMAPLFTNDSKRLPFEAGNNSWPAPPNGAPPMNGINNTSAAL